MILKTKEFKETCSVILNAVDSSELSTLTETLEIKTQGNILFISTTNKEYYASVKFVLDHEEDFHACVNATLFLKLIANITTDQIQMEVTETYLKIEANGKYKLPMIFENEQLMNVPEIVIENPVTEMTIPSSVLEGIVNYNSKQLAIGSAAKPVQKMFYMDNEGCITFTTGACVTIFELPVPVKVLFNSRLVNLFKLFKGTAVKFTLGYDAISDTIIQTKVCFETADIKLTAITGCDDTLLNQVPVNAIRQRANKTYDNCVVLSVAAVSEAINRLLLFSAGYGSKENLKPYSLFQFTQNTLTVYDSRKDNTELLNYQNGTNLTSDYDMTLDLMEFKKVLDSCSEQYVTLNFGDHKACVITRNNVRNVLPEVVTVGSA